MDRIAILSNVNINFVTRKLKKSFSMYEGEGYGNELGVLLNEESSYYTFAPQVTFLIMDLAELLQHEVQEETSREILKNWFQALRRALQKGSIFYISDAYYWSPEKEALPYDFTISRLEEIYHEYLREVVEEFSNVRVFPYQRLIRALGEETSFSEKTWYLGKIMHTNELQSRMAAAMEEAVRREQRTGKKVLLLDLDNTLWGGLAGNYPQEELELSEDHQGLAYKNAQRVILHMKEAGVVLAIVSKNNEKDALRVMEEHPHMVLKKEDFSALRINWEPKNLNILEICAELNVGVDSMVFWDDQESERELVRQMLPQVEVPQFPATPQELAGALIQVYNRYFRKPRLTREDREKTLQYARNKQRRELENAVTDYGQYLRNLKLTLERVDEKKNLERLLQLCNKTNQFNLTTQRYERDQLQNILEDLNKKVYLYRIGDVFGDYGIVSALIVDVKETPVIEEFVLSCRVMGKRVEYAIVSQVEKDLWEQGFATLKAVYKRTDRNLPVEELYDKLGYTCTEEEETVKYYERDLSQIPEREYYVTLL